VVSASLVGGVAPGPARATHGDATPRAVWSWPVAPPHPVVRPFSAPEHAWSPGHRGIDIGAAPGTTVTAPDDGVVRFSGTVVDRPVLSITHADGVISSLEPVTSDLSAGEAVSRDDDAVHLGARLDGEYVSPLLMLGGGRPSVLLPTRQID
jgi:murein DD-endopeptidase MepM/ murein hydrolase activator NlpD